LRVGATREAGEAIHAARKHLKRVRAVLRLVRGRLGKEVFGRENSCIRDAGRGVSAVRDAQVLLDTFRRLEKDTGAPAKLFAATRRLLERNLRQARDESADLGKISVRLEEVRDRVKDWPLAKCGWCDVCRGLRRVYSCGRKAFRIAAEKPTTPHLHAWRKRVKDLFYQMQVIENAWPKVLGDLVGQARLLGDHLGQDHDLALLREFISSQVRVGGAASEAKLLFRAIEARRAELQQAALDVGARLYIEKPTDFASRVAGYGMVWQSANRSTAPTAGNGSRRRSRHGSLAHP
jgi:CHAD domain-containing protein